MPTSLCPPKLVLTVVLNVDAPLVVVVAAAAVVAAVERWSVSVSVVFWSASLR